MQRCSKGSMNDERAACGAGACRATWRESSLYRASRRSGCSHDAAKGPLSTCHAGTPRLDPLSRLRPAAAAALPV